ncbi:MAG: DUF58 domain-containing protein [Bacteroidetes bacterium]|jgi:uncharacterized protein (DUF58 family)|nr:DUF58 domain-containing protein [Bacteroidota bacterium]MBT5527969.1 DUF58 domain-containing protein [Cytophagia bacterium]MBT3422536.1 DUF58 domain-containing protein [Bacteroidota bacterium]MBT3800375.1 DUF58 domain-containing protein [Bacteroidota bacterium]MBT3934668.1 DUF58 domain-containing protein [Bacteroidota bacterium]
MDTSEIIKKVRRIEIKTKGLSNHLFAGEYQTTFKGRGMSFSEVREYQYGDDIRSIDWNVTARFNTPFVKVFEEERELTVMMLIDVSQSDYFGTQVQFKNEMMTEIAAVLSFSAIHNDDKVGVIFFSDKIEKYIPPKKGRQHILRIIRELIDFKPESSGTDIALALRYFTNIAKKRAITFLMSDFIAEDYEKALRIASKKHDLIGINIYDKREEELPPVGLMRVRDAESNKIMWVDTANKKSRDLYKNWFIEKSNVMQKAFIKSGADLISIRTDQSYTTALINFFRNRGKRS